MLKFLRNLKLFKAAKLVVLWETIEDILYDTNAMLFISLFKLIVVEVFLLHFIACGWHYIGSTNLDEEAEEGFVIDDVDSWIVHFQIADADFNTRYLSSFYWTVTTMTTVGYGDISPQSNAEQAYSILIQVVSRDQSFQQF